jgi:hypothetical protein
LFQAGALYENHYFLGTSIARPLIAKGMVELGSEQLISAKQRQWSQALKKSCSDPGPFTRSLLRKYVRINEKKMLTCTGFRGGMLET